MPRDSVNGVDVEPMNQRRVTMADVARKVGGSRIAVSMALRDHHRISFERRRKIKIGAKEMGFVPDPLLLALAAHRRQRVLAKEKFVGVGLLRLVLSHEYKSQLHFEIYLIHFFGDKMRSLIRYVKIPSYPKTNDRQLFACDVCSINPVVFPRAT